MRKLIWFTAPLLILILAFRSLTNHTITGLITDETGSVIANATVIVKAGKEAATSGVNGKYTIVVGNKNVTLIFSAVGFATQEISAKGRSTINVKLKTSSAALQEVVVTG
ncbi:MAG: carboxypeptidase-like regulatory domain-containing protein, partial [Chitinophagaceae bacterium]